MKVFEKGGKDCTQETVNIVLEAAKANGIKNVVVASNTGDSAAPYLGRIDNVVIVTHQQGFKVPGENEMDIATRRQLEEAGAQVLTTTHLFGGVERGIAARSGGSFGGSIISDSLRMFSQGVKVAVEVAVMALDAGMIPYGEPILAVGGSGRGSDTALIIEPDHSNNIFKTNIVELLCMPGR